MMLFVGYNVYLLLVKPKISMYQNQQQKNYSFAQDCIYNNKAKNIIVGSSMAARMYNDFLPKDFYNLSFSGGSVLTGLEIIKKSGFIPKNIYIENNVIFRKEDSKMIGRLFYPILWNLKGYVPALKERYQPLNIIASKIKGSYGKTYEEHMNEKRDENIFNMSIKINIKNYNKSLVDYQNKLDKLKDLVTYFENKGVKILFFEMPIYEILANSLKAREQRNIIKTDFNNKWLKSPNNKYYKTTDGIHLMYKSAFVYSKNFIREVEILND